MKQLMIAFWQDDSGPELVEWAVVMVILLVASVVGLVALRNELIPVIRSIFGQMQQSPATDY